ncbi:MAG: flagellar basal body rod protein FlgC [Verrucomicrobiota bacterium]|jgi:flagellar basal-body rod protein FlgC|nr:flagellar basal body rod protein FlgC [Verrucomicrobiota bacterium]|tara:strand:+ start:1728 stop:2159 length:432 start_codon:yes stop_codon:yes gene_type:complete
MDLIPGLQSSASALHAERIRMEVISQNIANANTTKAEDGEPYRRQLVHFDVILRKQMGQKTDLPSNNLSEVRASKIIEDSRPFREVYQPGHPDADGNGMVKYPNVHIHEEMADLISASRAYEANMSLIRTSRTLAMQTINMGK